MFHGCLALAVACAVSVAADEDDSASAPQYNRDIRRILSDNCFFCHGPDKNQRKAKLRLDIREDALAHEAFVPGQPDESELVRRIFATDKDDLMPPPESNKQLTTEQKELLKRWVAAGAEYEPHWSFIPARRPEVPEVKNPERAANPVDAFLLRKLDAKGLETVGPADRRTLLRRLSLDLIGLPPAPDEMSAFLQDEDPRAYEKQVDRLLGSPHFGERMAVPWLDVVRYADTVGYHGDQNQNIFPYRDYVIDAFNDNKPFDEFTIEQLAGDLLPDPTEEQLIATGFNRLNMVTREGGAQAKEYLAKYQADRVRTVSTAWLGATMACTECHDHKFDPFTMKDFYSMEAFFADLKQWGVYSYYDYAPVPELKGFNNDSPFPPEIEVQSRYLKQRRERLVAQADRLMTARQAELKVDEKAVQDFEAWIERTSSYLNLHPEGWRPLSVAKVESKKLTQARVQEDGSILFEGKAVRGEEHTVETMPLPGRLAAVRVQVLPDETHDHSVARDGRKAFELGLRLALRRSGETDEQSLPVHFADANFKKTRYDQGLPVVGIQDRWASRAEDSIFEHDATFLLARPLSVRAGDVLVVKLESEDIGRVRLGAGSLSWPASQLPIAAAAVREALAEDAEKREASDRELLRAAYLLSEVPAEPFLADYQKLQSSILDCRDGRTFTMVAEAVEEPMTTRVLPRGNWMDDSGEVVDPAPPHFLTPIWDRPEASRMTRLDLAKWLVDRENPLTARNFMNRLWKQIFGSGICATVEDLGLQGEWPTHPDLLDWLAAEFMESGWDIKRMVKLLVMSNAYRRDSEPTRALLDADPFNRFYGRMSARRLPAELVRDNALAISGLINLDVGGPSARPYQPAGYYEHLNFPKRDYHAHQDDRQYRRGVYMHWQRTFLHPMLANFDAQSREECIPDRTTSNSPQQALTLLNDPTFFEASRVFAEKVLREKPGATFGERLEFAFQRALARTPTPEEAASLRAFHEVQLKHLREHGEEADELLRVGLDSADARMDRTELAAWTAVCRVLLNLHETITRY